MRNPTEKKQVSVKLASAGRLSTVRLSGYASSERKIQEADMETLPRGLFLKNNVNCESCEPP